MLLKDERHSTLNETKEAAAEYEASIEPARKHRFVHEKAIACELAGYFNDKCWDEKESREMFSSNAL